MITTRLGKLSDVPDILRLQSSHLYRNLSPQEAKQGFITMEFSLTQIEELIDQNGVFIAQSYNDVIGYAVAGNWNYLLNWNLLSLMLDRLQFKSYKGHQINPVSSFHYGPVCVSKEFRGRDVYRALFLTMKKECSHKFPIGLAFINKSNRRSYEAHKRKLGSAIEVIDEFEFGDNSYYSMIFLTS